MIIQDGSGTGYRARVNSENSLHTQAITRNEDIQANYNGHAYNFNTGKIAITGTSGTLYLKNTSIIPFQISSLVVGVGSGGTYTDNIDVYLVKNPTAGTVISGETSVDMKENRNFGSTDSAGAIIYKGADGDTFTDGIDSFLFYQNGQGRLFAEISVVLEPGSSIGVRIEPNLSVGTINVYTALVGFFQDTSI